MTQKLKHTPGPWFVKPCPSGGWRRYIMRDPQEHQLYSLAVTDEANARIIAAAPRLLEALKPFARAHQTWSGGNAKEHFSLAVTPTDFLRAFEAVASVEMAA